MILTRKKQVVKWQTSPVGVFKLRHCVLDMSFWNVSVSRRSRDVFLECLFSSRSWRLNVSVSSRSWEFEKMERLGLVSVLKVDRLGLVSVLWLNVLWTSMQLRHSDLVYLVYRSLQKILISVLWDDLDSRWAVCYNCCTLWMQVNAVTADLGLSTVSCLRDLKDGKILLQLAEKLWELLASFSRLQRVKSSN